MVRIWLVRFSGMHGDESLGQGKPLTFVRKYIYIDIGLGKTIRLEEKSKIFLFIITEF